MIALGAVWAIHAGIDWDWEMPVVTLWLFALAGLALSRPRRRGALARRSGPGAAGARALALAALPVLVAGSQADVDAAVAALAGGDCVAASTSAQDALEPLGVWSQAHQVLGYCDGRRGDDPGAEREMEAAIDRDPDNWRTHYGLALVRALAGRDPLPQLRLAHRLDPLERSLGELVRQLRRAGPAQWREWARSAPLQV